ncbi:11137_t:CDS:2, partial [Dentiscutata erythropus]
MSVNTTKVFDDNSFLPIVYEANFTVDLEIFEEFKAWLQEHLSTTLNTKAGFRDAEIFQRDPQKDGSDEIKNPDQVHKYITVLFEIDNKENIDHYLKEESSKVKETLESKFKKSSVTTSYRILYPVSLWAKRKSLEKS